MIQLARLQFLVIWLVVKKKHKAKVLFTCTMIHGLYVFCVFQYCCYFVTTGVLLSD
jgi:hypothetical protein